MMEKLTEFPYLLAIIFIVVGAVMLFFPPKNINYLYGYRTPRAMKNQQNWTFAQRYAARMLILGGILLAVFAISLDFLFHVDAKLNGLIIFLSTIVVLGLVFFKTESALKNFEKTL